MPPPQEESLRSLLTRSDFASLDVPLAKLCTWIGDGWLEQVGTAPTADGTTGEPVYAIISRQLRAELLPKLEQIGKTAAALTPMRARSQLLRLMLARKGILLPFDHGDDIVSVKTRLIEELAAGLLGPDLAQALEDAAADLEREVEAALQQLDGKSLPEVFGPGVEPAWKQVEAATAPPDQEEEEEEEGDFEHGAEEAEWFVTSDLLDETSVWADEEDDEADAEPWEPSADAAPEAAGDATSATPTSALAEYAADPIAAANGDTATPQSEAVGEGTDDADDDDLQIVETDAEIEAVDEGAADADDDDLQIVETDAEIESVDEGTADADDSLPIVKTVAEIQAVAVAATEADTAAPESEAVDEGTADAADELPAIETDAEIEVVTVAATEVADGTAEDAGGEDDHVLEVAGDEGLLTEPAPDPALADAESGAFADAAEMTLCVDAVMAAEQTGAVGDDGAAPEGAAAAGPPVGKDERVTEAELASLAGASDLLDFGVTFHDGLTEEDVAERLVPQVAMAITDTLVAMLGDESAPLAGSLSQGGRIDLQPLTHELEQLRLATQQLGQRDRPAVDLTVLTHEVEQMRGAVQQLAERPPLSVDTTAVTQELSRLCSLVELLADRRADPPGIQKIASALELGFARMAAAPAEMIAGIKQIGTAIADAQAAHAEAITTLPAARPQPRDVATPRVSAGHSLVPVAVIGLLLVCWAVVLYVKFGDARLALGSLLAVSMIGSTLVAFRRD